MPAASRFATIGASRSFGGDVGIERRPCGRALARHVDKVLPGDRNAIERARRAPLTMTFAARFRFFKRALARDQNERWIVVVAFDAIQKEFRDLDRIELAFGDETPDLGGGLVFQIVDHVAGSLRCREPTARARLGETSVAIPLCYIDFGNVGEEAILRTLSAVLIFAAAIASRAPAFAADPFPATGAAKLAAYSVCRSAVIVDMGPVGSNSSAECTGIVKTLDGSKLLDNLAIRCIEESKARRAGYAFSGTCIQTDGDGDKIFMTYEGPEGGAIALIGGTGKYQDITGKGTWSVVDAPGNNAQLFAFTLTYDIDWTTKTK